LIINYPILIVVAVILGSRVHIPAHPEAAYIGYFEEFARTGGESPGAIENRFYPDDAIPSLKVLLPSSLAASGLLGLLFSVFMGIKLGRMHRWGRFVGWFIGGAAVVSCCWMVAFLYQKSLDPLNISRFYSQYPTESRIHADVLWGIVLIDGGFNWFCALVFSLFGLLLSFVSFSNSPDSLSLNRGS